MATSQSHFSAGFLRMTDGQRTQVRRARAHVDLAETEFHAAAETWETAGHPDDGELLYAYKRAAVWLLHVTGNYQSAVESTDRLLNHMFVRDESHR